MYKTIVNNIFRLVKSDMSDEKLSNLTWRKWLKVFAFKAGVAIMFTCAACAIIWFAKH